MIIMWYPGSGQTVSRRRRLQDTQTLLVFVLLQENIPPRRPNCNFALVFLLRESLLSCILATRGRMRLLSFTRREKPCLGPRPRPFWATGPVATARALLPEPGRVWPGPTLAMPLLPKVLQGGRENVSPRRLCVGFFFFLQKLQCRAAISQWAPFFTKLRWGSCCNLATRGPPPRMPITTVDPRRLKWTPVKKDYQPAKGSGRSNYYAFSRAVLLDILNQGKGIEPLNGIDQGGSQTSTVN